MNTMSRVEPLPPVRGSLERDKKLETIEPADLLSNPGTRSRSGPQVRHSSSQGELEGDRIQSGPKSVRVTAGAEQRELSLENKTTVPSSPRKSESMKKSMIRPRVLSGKRTRLAVGSSSSQRLNTAERRHSPLPNVLAQQNLEKLSAKFHRNHQKQSTSLPHFAQGSLLEDHMGPATSSQRVPSTLPSQPDSGSAAERLGLGTAPDARVVTDLVNQANREGKINNIVRTSQRDPLTGLSSSRARISPSPAVLNRVFNGSASVHRSSERLSTPEARQALIVSPYSYCPFLGLIVIVFLKRAKKIIGNYFNP